MKSPPAPVMMTILFARYSVKGINKFRVTLRIHDIRAAVPNGKAVARARELADLYLKAPEVTRRNTRIHFIQPRWEHVRRTYSAGRSNAGRRLGALLRRRQCQHLPAVRVQAFQERAAINHATPNMIVD